MNSSAPYLTKESEKGDFPNVPEYVTEDSLGDRLVALVRLEQFMNEKTFTPGVMSDLEAIIELARKADEPKIATIAELILNQSRKYLKP